MRHTLSSAVAVVAGALVGWIDTRPGWDDTGITIGCIVTAAGVLSFAIPKHAWIRALLIGIPVFAFNLASTGGLAAAAAIPVALVAAYAGVLARSALSPQVSTAQTEEEKEEDRFQSAQ